MTKTVSDVRAGFLDFFKKNGHEVRPSGSLVPHNDPTLMFANAGMNQFKNVFTGAEKLPFVRAATSQKCVRAGGKHNDLDNVGYTARHHTFFEMLGNFSFGDYFKQDAIELAWNLLTKDFGLNKDKLYVTVYHTDDEAFNIWKKLTGFADSKIIRIDTNDNFWSMGDTGPCGPCSEIFYDHGAHIAGGLPGTADADGDRYIEIWNLVFMQYEQLEGGERISLPKPSIDTGMGLERISAVMQGVHDNYDIDLFKNIIAASKHESRNTEHEVSHRVIADHLRSSCFLIADGVLPSNEGRGYVLRRIMRRAMRHAHQLGCKDPLMYKLVPALITEMGAQYPELSRAEATITENLRAEEERFKQTLERGLKLLDDELSSCGLQSSSTGSRATEKDPAQPKGSQDDVKFSGEIAFKLYDTYGFPLDLTQDILRTKGLEVDTDGFEKAMENQREMARTAHKGSGDTATGKIWFELKEKLNDKFCANKFLGYEQESAEAKILAIVKDGAEVNSANAGDKVFVVLDQTPFYGESGGQVGDIGNFSDIATIANTSKPLDDFFVHEATLLKPIKIGDKITAQINVANRNSIRANHSATHLLHKALRDVLGEHVTQKGSQVAADRLRFDISHNKPVSREEIAEIERRVNEVIWQNTPITTQILSADDAIKAGAMALFGEKYGDKVRVLSMGLSSPNPESRIPNPYSVELCGGTHASATGDIGLLKIVSEGAVAAGIRRLEAVTRGEAFKYLSEQENTLRDMANSLKVAVSEVPARVEQIATERKKLEKDLADAKKQIALGGGSGGAEAKPEQVGAYSFIAKNFDGLDPKELRGVAEGFIKQAQIAVVSTVVEGKVSVVVAVEKVASEKISAVTLVQAAVAELGGKGGGGRPDMAQGGGADAAALPKAIEKIKSLLG
ncbi:MAG: alanine--tRNA ligase [Pseudomonadota bacterium]